MSRAPRVEPPVDMSRAREQAVARSRRGPARTCASAPQVRHLQSAIGINAFDVVVTPSTVNTSG